jgi:hypothetical protein
MPKAKAQRWHPRSLAMGKQRDFQGFSSKSLKSCENTRSPGNPFWDLFPPFNSCRCPPEKVTSLQLLGAISRQLKFDVPQIRTLKMTTGDPARVPRANCGGRPLPEQKLTKATDQPRPAHVRYRRWVQLIAATRSANLSAGVVALQACMAARGKTCLA